MILSSILVLVIYLIIRSFVSAMSSNEQLREKEIECV